VEPVEFLHVANRLRGSEAEGDRRTSISRAYYSLFNTLKQHLGDLNKFKDDDQDHAALRHYLINSNEKDLSSVGQTLGSLRVLRNDADYRMELEIDVAKANTVYARAESAIARFQAVPRNTVVAYIKALPSYGFRLR
jgi:hypothetical protein